MPWSQKLRFLHCDTLFLLFSEFCIEIILTLRLNLLHVILHAIIFCLVQFPIQILSTQLLSCYTLMKQAISTTFTMTMAWPDMNYIFGLQLNQSDSSVQRITAPPGGQKWQRLVQDSKNTKPSLMLNS